MADTLWHNLGEQWACDAQRSCDEFEAESEACAFSLHGKDHWGATCCKTRAFVRVETKGTPKGWSLDATTDAQAAGETQIGPQSPEHAMN